MLPQKVKEQIAPHGYLRVAINMSNFLLVNSVDENGAPDGVSPAIARALASELGIDSKIIEYDGPGQIADAATADEWDIANIAAETARAKVIRFSPAYCEIQASFLLPPESTVFSLEDVDQPGHRIAVKERSAYDLWLTDNLEHAALVRAPSLDESFIVFEEQQLDALAGLRPKLIQQQALMPDSRILESSFTSVMQSIGCKLPHEEAAQYISNFVDESIKNGLVERLIKQYGVWGQLAVATA